MTIIDKLINNIDLYDCKRHQSNCNTHQIYSKIISLQGIMKEGRDHPLFYPSLQLIHKVLERRLKEIQNCLGANLEGWRAYGQTPEMHTEREKLEGELYEIKSALQGDFSNCRIYEIDQLISPRAVTLAGRVLPFYHSAENLEHEHNLEVERENLQNYVSRFPSQIEQCFYKYLQVTIRDLEAAAVQSIQFTQVEAEAYKEITSSNHVRPNGNSSVQCILRQEIAYWLDQFEQNFFSPGGKGFRSGEWKLYKEAAVNICPEGKISEYLPLICKAVGEATEEAQEHFKSVLQGFHSYTSTIFKEDITIRIVFMLKEMLINSKYKHEILNTLITTKRKDLHQAMTSYLFKRDLL